jgi:hypothetical protein
MAAGVIDPTESAAVPVIVSSDGTHGANALKHNYLLIDFENVQPTSLALLAGHPFRVVVFVGAHQNRIPLELARSLQSFGEDGQYMQMAGSGRNALDFHIAFTLGELTSRERDAAYYIVSRDAGFDPLIRTLSARGLHVTRVKELADIPLLRMTNGTSLAEKVEAVVQNLRTLGASRPRKVRTLRNAINSLFLKSLKEPELDEIMDTLVREGYVAVEKDNVTYQLPTP